MRKKQAVVAGLGLLIAVIGLLALWPYFRAESPEPIKQESSSQPFPDRQTPIAVIQPSQNESTPGEEKRAAAAGSQEKSKSPIRGMHGEKYSFSSASWVMEQQRIGPEGLMKESSVSKVWIKGDKKRVETFRTLGAWSGTALQPAIIVFSDRDYVYAYYPDQKRMFRLPRAFSLEVLAEKWTKKRSEAKIRTEVVDGKTCDVYHVVNDVNVGGLGTVAMEVQESRWQGLVLKEISRPIGSRTADILTTQLKDVQLDVAIPDEKFVLPTDVRIEDAKLPPEEVLRKTFR